jgi:large subunit ribosomal protein L13
MKTFSPKSSQTTRDWHLLDAKGQVLGRLATQVAVWLMGKHKSTFSRHLDQGDHVVVINAAKVTVTGRKADQKLYHRHSGYPGGMKVTSFADLMARDPAQVVTTAVSGMLPDNKLKGQILHHLHVYPSSSHPYAKQFQN